MGSGGKWWLILDELEGNLVEGRGGEWEGRRERVEVGVLGFGNDTRGIWPLVFVSKVSKGQTVSKVVTAPLENVDYFLYTPFQDLYSSVWGFSLPTGER